MILKSKLIKSVLIIAILVTAVKQILLTQVIYALSTGSITLSSSASGNASINILPTDKDEVRSYKWKDELVTLSKYVETNGKQMIEMEKEIAESSLTPDQKKRFLAERELDFGYSYEEKIRCRCNVYFQKGYISIALRLIPKTIKGPGKTAEE